MILFNEFEKGPEVSVMVRDWYDDYKFIKNHLYLEKRPFDVP